MPRPKAEHYVAPVDASDVVVDAPHLSQRKSNLWLDAWRDLRKRPLLYVALVIVVVVLAMALFPTWFTDVPPNDQCMLSNSNGGPEAGHPLGFTRQGCDVWSRIVWGARTSLLVGLFTVLITAVIGIPMGALAGFYGGKTDSVLSRIGDIFYSVPYFLAAVVVMSVIQPEQRNPFTIAFAIGGFSWAVLARLLRAEILQVKNRDYITASRAVGRSRWSTLLGHALPNSLTPVIVTLTISLGAAIVAEATLGFLGIGLPPETMSWGNDISDAQVTIRTSPMTLVYPSIALTVTVLAFIILGELIRDALDPKARATR
jgi:oligopeptide transport system permease protein